MSVDEQLLARNNSTEEDDNEAVLAGNFRESQRGNTMDDNNPATSLRERKKAEMAKDEEDKDRANGLLKRKIAQKMSPFLAMTDRLLQASWTNLITSFGLTLLWIDIHFFMNKVLGPMAFRELGEEWVPEHIKRLGGEKAKEGVAMIKKTEEIGCGCLNLGCLIIVIGALSVMSMIAVAMEHPFETLWEIWLKDSLSDFVNMIKSLL